MYLPALFFPIFYLASSSENVPLKSQYGIGKTLELLDFALVKQQSILQNTNRNVERNQEVAIDKTFKSYESQLFEGLRRFAGINEQEYLQQIKSENLIWLNSDSKSGQYFWKSKNGKIILKTIKPYECKTFQKLLKPYYRHVLSAPTGFVTILGLYRITNKYGQKVYFMASKNVFYNLKNVTAMYDLKGSTIGRHASKKSLVSKDLDLIQSDMKLQLGPRSKRFVLDALQRDVRFLSQHGLMDYSLLIAVEGRQEQTVSTSPYNSNSNRNNDIKTRFPLKFWRQSELQDDRGKMVILGNDSHLIFHFGIIDFLQRYTFRKYCETWLKGFLYDASKISSVNPVLYAKRFISFLSDYFI